jgi:ATP phosphoribosyltransferase
VATGTLKDKLVGAFAAAGYARCEPPILHPAKVFLDLSGEDIRGRLYLTSDSSGAEFCLRPEYTIPVCRAYLASGAAAANPPPFPTSARFSGSGRAPAASSRRPGSKASAAQIARPPTPKSSACRLRRRAAGRADLSVKIGDAGLFSRLLDRARPAAGLAAPHQARADAQGQPRAHFRRAGEWRGERSFRRSRRARRRRPQGRRQGAGRGPLSIAGIRAVGGRSARFPKSPTASSNNPRPAPARRSRTKSAWCWSASSTSPATPTPPRPRCARSPTIADSTERRSTPSTRGSGSSPRAASMWPSSTSPPASPQSRLLHRLRVRGARPRTPWAARHRRRPLRQAAGKTLGAGRRHSGRRRRHLGRPSDAIRRRGMTALNSRLFSPCPPRGGCRRTPTPSSPAPGSNVDAGARRARLSRRAAGLPGVEIAFLSASEIVAQLAAGSAHLGVTGEDLVRENVPDADAKMAADAARLRPRQCRRRRAAGLDRRAQHGRSRGRRRRLPRQTRRAHARRHQIHQSDAGLFRRHGVTDYRIVESLGATEGAPAAGQAELIVDITTTGATLKANGLKVLDDGVMLRSQANLVASLQEAARRAMDCPKDRVAQLAAMAPAARAYIFSAKNPAGGSHRGQEAIDARIRARPRSRRSPRRRKKRRREKEEGREYVQATAASARAKASPCPARISILRL